MSAIPGRAASRSHPSPIKTVLVYRNGDAFFPGRRFVINPRQVSSFDSFLNTVTGGVEASFGAVRNVYTPREGHRIQSLETLQHGEKYVAGGTERFKKMKSPKERRIKPVVHSRIIVPARWRKFLHESCTINVFTNGDVVVPPARILIPKYTLRSWERVLAMVTEKVHLRTGAVHRLYMLDGTPLSGSVELENNHYYVATGVERFRLLPYFHWFADHRQQADSLFYAKSERERAARAARKQQPVSTTTTSTSTPLLLLSSGEGSVFKAKSRRRETVGVEAKVVQEEQCDVIMALSPQPDSGGGETFCSIGPMSASSKASTRASTRLTSASPEQPAPRSRPPETGRVTRTRTHTPVGTRPTTPTRDTEPLQTPAKTEQQPLSRLSLKLKVNFNQPQALSPAGCELQPWSLLLCVCVCVCVRPSSLQALFLWNVKKAPKVAATAEDRRRADGGAPPLLLWLLFFCTGQGSQNKTEHWGGGGNRVREREGDKCVEACESVLELSTSTYMTGLVYVCVCVRSCIKNRSGLGH
ncbi:unnamed protein product, partial [Coregonus sp. 'balchen']